MNNILETIYNQVYYTNKYQAKISEPISIEDFLAKPVTTSYRGLLNTTYTQDRAHLILVLDLDTKHNPTIKEELQSYLNSIIKDNSSFVNKEYPFVLTKNKGQHIYIEITIPTSIINNYGIEAVRKALKLNKKINIKGLELKTIDITGIGSYLPNIEGVNTKYNIHLPNYKRKPEDIKYYTSITREEALHLTNASDIAEILYKKANPTASKTIITDFDTDKLTNQHFIGFFIRQAKKNVADSQDYNNYIGTYLNLCLLSKLYGIKYFYDAIKNDYIFYVDDIEIGEYYKDINEYDSIVRFYNIYKKQIWGDSIYYETIPEYEDLPEDKEQKTLEYVVKSYEYWVSNQKNSKKTK